MLQTHLFPTIITFASAVFWLRMINFLTGQGYLPADLGRKIIHIGTGPIFVICWLLFDNVPSARFFAAIVPLVITLQFILVGSGIIRDDKAVKSMSRSGDRREILKGPLYYGILFVIITLLFWLDTPIGIVSLMILCGGDGLADILGRRFGKVKIPWNPRKSLVGSLGMFLGGFALSIIIMAIFIQAGVFTEELIFFITPILVIVSIATLIESLPIDEIDNITITLGSVISGMIFF